MSMPRIGQVLLVGEAHLAGAAAEQRLERLAEIRVDGLERLGEFLARHQVDLLNRLLGVADGIDQVLPLRAQEVVALLRFLELFHGRRVHRAQRLDAAAHFAGTACSASAMASASGDGSSARSQFLHRAVQFLAAGLVQELQLGLLAHQFHFDLRALLVRLLHAARSAFSSSSPARRALRACPRPAAAISFTLGFQRRRSARPVEPPSGPARCCRPAGARAARPGARSRARWRCAAAWSSRNCCSRRPMAARSPRCRSSSPASSARSGGVLFARSRRPALPASPARRAALQRLFALRAQVLLLLPRPRDCARAARRDFSASRRRPLQFQARHREPRVGARQIVAQLAHLVIQRHAILLARLLQRRAAAPVRPRSRAISWFKASSRATVSSRARCRFVQRDGQLARFALHGQRTGARLLAAGHRVAVIADAVRQQEVQMRIAGRPAAAPKRDPRPGSRATGAAAGPWRDL